MRLASILLIAACGSGSKAPPPANVARPVNPYMARDFHKPGSWRFDYSQAMTLSRDGMDTPSTFAGTIAVTSDGLGTAKAEVVANDPGMPPLSFTLQETATELKMDRPEQIMFLLFPFPSKPLAPDGRETFNITFPLSAGRSVQDIPIALEITRLASDTIDGLPCTHLDLAFAIERATAKLNLNGDACIATDGLPVVVDLTMAMAFEGPPAFAMTTRISLKRTH